MGENHGQPCRVHVCKNIQYIANRDGEQDTRTLSQIVYQVLGKRRYSLCFKNVYVPTGRLMKDAGVQIRGYISFGPRQANLVLIAYASSEGSGEPAHPRSLARTFAARSYKQ